MNSKIEKIADDMGRAYDLISMLTGETKIQLDHDLSLNLEINDEARSLLEYSMSYLNSAFSALEEFN